MRWLKLTLAYDGTHYAGWQYQPGQTSIQETLEEALFRITGEKIRVTASGRTDAGVHALGQVVSLSTSSRLSSDVLRRALNAELPRDIAVLAAEEAPEGFHAIRDAIQKRYRYFIHDGPVRDVFRRHHVWHLPFRLDAEAMHEAAQALCGMHDFSSFESSGAPRSSSVRTVTEVLVARGAGGEPPQIVTIDVEADGFLYNMVRAIVGTLVEVGKGDRPREWIAEVLAAKNRRSGGQTAPPQGLFLLWVQYAPPPSAPD